MFGNCYSSLYDSFNSKKPYKKEIKFVYEWAKKPKSIFDIGAGTGSYWKYYPKNVRVFGVDKSPDMSRQSTNIACSDITEYIHGNERFDCATALFDVLNYIPTHNWWKNIPLKKGGFFIFDIWDKEKVDKDGFQETSKMVDNCWRVILPLRYDGKKVDLKIQVWGADFSFSEKHRMYIYSHKDIERFCDNDFKIVEVKPTSKWQTWYKCKRK